MKRVDLLLPSKKPLSFESYVAEELATAFSSLGVEMGCVVTSERSFLEYLREVKEKKPWFTLAFSEGPTLKELGLPHLHWEWRSLAESLHLVKNPSVTLGVNCRKMEASCKKGGWNVQFLPPCASSKTRGVTEEKRYEVVFLDHLIDPVCLEENWPTFLSPGALKVLAEVIEKCKKDPSLSVLEALFATSFEGASVSDVLFSAEEYLQAERVHALVEACEGVRVDLFGEHVGNNWLRRLKNGDNVFLHSSLPYVQPYEELSEVLHSSKIVVRDHVFQSCDGCDEWVFAAIQQGALPVMRHTPYLEEALGEHAPFFTTSAQAAHHVHHYLAHAGQRKELVTYLQERVQENHTFEKRVKELVKLCE